MTTTTITTVDGIISDATVLAVSVGALRAVVRDSELGGYAVVVRESDERDEWRWLETFPTLVLASRPADECAADWSR